MPTAPNGNDHDTRDTSGREFLADLMMRHLPDALIVLRDGVVTWCSPAIEDLLGLVPESLRDAPLADLVHPEDRDALTAACAAAEVGGRESLTVRMRGAGDTQVMATIWLQARAEGDGIVVAIRPATAGLDADDAQHEVEVAARRLAELAGDVLWIVDGTGAVIEVGPAIHDLLALLPEEAAAVGPISLVHPDDHPKLQAYRKAVQAGTARGSIEIRARARGGGFRWVRATGLMVRDGGANPEDTRVIVSWRDIDSLVRDTRFAEREAERLRDILDSALDPWLMLEPVRDARGEIVDFSVRDANAGAASYLRWPRERILGVRLRDEFPALIAHGVMRAYIDAMESGQPLVIHDLVYPHELFGEDRRYEIRAQGSGGSLMLTWRDTTPSSRARDELAASEIFFRGVAGSSGDAVVALKGDAVQWASPGAAALGLSPGTDFERVMCEVVVPDSASQVRTCCTLLEGAHAYAGRWHRPNAPALVVCGRPMLGNGVGVVTMIAEDWTEDGPGSRGASG